MKCPCGSDKEYGKCCEKIIKGEVNAKTPEELMRARYSAYVNSEIDFIFDSVLPEKQEEDNRAAIEEWAAESTWQNLEIIKTEGGIEEDDVEGKVEFKANYISAGMTNVYHELGDFKKIDGKWYFDEGKLVKEYPSKKIERKVGRNDPCPCGSGKKYKKCCG